MAQYRTQVAYGLSQALINEAPVPVQAKRAPTTADIGFLPGTIWVNLVAGTVYILTGVASNLATWLEVSNGPGSFTTLTSTGATTLATTGASVNTFGNTTGATSLSLYAGTGNFLIDGAASTTITVGTSLTTGTISIGGSVQTGTLTIAGGTGAQTINIAAASTGVKTINIGSGAVANVITIGSQTAGAELFLSSGTLGTLIESVGGPVELESTSNAPGAIYLFANGGTSESIQIQAGQGTGAASIDIISTAGGITMQTPAAKGITISNGTQAPGIYVGTGSPNGSLTAAQGSIFLNVAGSSSSTRMYVNSNGTTGWVAFTTAS